MIRIAVLALGVAAVNVAVGWWLAKAAPGRMGVQAAGFLFRFAAIFGAAQAVWVARRRAAEVVVFILTAAIAQLVGQIYLFLRKKERKADHAS